ncbi:hypothetical protein ABWK90_004391 [Vibrio vulnificus]
MLNIPFRLAVITDKYTSLLRKEEWLHQLNEQLSLEEVQKQRLAQSIILDEKASDIFLKHCPKDFFDTRLEVHTANFPLESDDYLSLNNPRYATTQFNKNIIDDLMAIKAPELQSLIEWMKIHHSSRWLLMGLLNISIAGKAVEYGQFKIHLSAHIFEMMEKMQTS